MVRILSDTSTLYCTEQAKQAGFNVAPLSVTIAGKTYREFDEISSEEFVSIIHQVHMPTSSQPAIGEVTALYEQYPEVRGVTVVYTGSELHGEKIKNAVMAALGTTSKRIYTVAKGGN